MIVWPVDRVAQALGTDVPGAAAPFTRVGTDTRALAPGALFVALRGERFDGHAFLAAARDAGATGAVVLEGTPDVDGLLLFRVPDTVAALGRLATARRRAIAGPVVAITGTNGKTATKELTARVLGAVWTVHATRANLNNEIGVPLTILEAPAETEALVVEAGASVPGEIGRLRRVIEPTAAIVTNVAEGHTEGFGDLAGVMREKLALLDGVPFAVVGEYPPGLAAGARARAGTVLVAGLGDGADVRPDACTLDGAGRPVLTFRGATVTLPLAGRHQAANAMLALALAEHLQVPVAAAVAALADVVLPGGRWEVHTAGRRMVVHDAYNANPASMLAALETVRHIAAGRPLVLLLGTMLELGGAEADGHRRIADAAVALAPALVGATGAFVPAFAPHAQTLGDRLVCADDADQLGQAVASRVPTDAVVLLKASHGVHLERALPHLLDDREAPCSTTS